MTSHRRGCIGSVSLLSKTLFAQANEKLAIRKKEGNGTSCQRLVTMCARCRPRLPLEQLVTVASGASLTSGQQIGHLCLATQSPPKLETCRSSLLSPLSSHPVDSISAFDPSRAAVVKSQSNSNNSARCSSALKGSFTTMTLQLNDGQKDRQQLSIVSQSPARPQAVR